VRLLYQEQPQRFNGRGEKGEEKIDGEIVGREMD
jgi:hypothetical protein